MIRPERTFVERDFILCDKRGEIIHYPTIQPELKGDWGFYQ